MGEPHLWTGARVFTGQRYAEALLVDDGKVVAVGSEEEVRRSAPTGTEVLPARGRLLLPGLIDAHLHLGDLLRSRLGLELSDVRGEDDLARRIRSWAEAHPEGPIVGRGLDVERSLGGRWPHREDLDRLGIDRPVVLLHASGHAAVVNSAALAASGVESSRAGELAGRVGRSADGRANGQLFEEAVRWLGALTTMPSDPSGIERTLDSLVALGLTTVVSMNISPEELSMVRSLASQGRLPTRVRAYVRLLRLEEYSSAELAAAGAPGRCSVVGAKGFTDGAFGPRTAWLSEPYADAPETSGVAAESDEALASALAVAHERGLAPALHAIGDRAVVRAARLLAPYVGGAGPMPRIEHVGLVPPSALSVLDEVRPALVVQPGFLWSDSWLAGRLGPERVRWAYIFRTLLDRGHLLAGSSDAPYDPVDPWRGLRAATARRDDLGRSANPDPHEAMTPEDAVRLYTVHAATVLGEPSLGSLEAGSCADLVVLEASGLADALPRGASAVREVWVDGVRMVPPSRSSGAE